MRFLTYPRPPEAGRRRRRHRNRRISRPPRSSSSCCGSGRTPKRTREVCAPSSASLERRTRCDIVIYGRVQVVTKQTVTLLNSFLVLACLFFCSLCKVAIVRSSDLRQISVRGCYCHEQNIFFLRPPCCHHLLGATG